MATLKPVQIAALTWNDWCPKDREKAIKFLDDAIAIVLAESGGNPEAISSTNDYGLWQINRKYHADLFGKYKWNDPADNTKMAHEVWKAAGNSWSPWATYGGSRYAANKGKGKAAYDEIQAGIKKAEGSGGGFTDFLGDLALATGGGPVGLIPGLVTGAITNGGSALIPDGIENPVKGVADSIKNTVAGALKDVFKFIATGFLTIAAFLFMISMFMWGFYLLTKDTALGKKVVGTAKTAAIAATTKKMA